MDLTENARLTPERKKELEEVLFGLLGTGFEPNTMALARRFDIGVSTVKAAIKKVREDYFAKGLPQASPSAEPGHVRPRIEEKIVEIGHSYESGRTIADIASEFEYDEADVAKVIRTLGVESPDERLARITHEERARSDEESAWSEHEIREAERFRSEAIAHETAKLPPGQPVTGPARTLIVPFSTRGAVITRDTLVVEAAPFGARYPIYEYLDGLEKDGKAFEIAELKRLLQDLAKVADLPNDKRKVLKGEMSGFWELRFGTHQQQRVFLRQVTLVVGPGKLEERVLVVLNGFTKKTRETPPREEARAQRVFAAFAESLEEGGRQLKNNPSKKDVEDAFKTTPDERLLMARLKLVEEFQLSILDFMWRRKITGEDLAKLLGASAWDVDGLLRSPDVSFEDLLKVAFTLGLQLHGSIGPALYK